MDVETRTLIIAEWLQARLLSSELLPFYFELRGTGLEAQAGADAVFELVGRYMLGGCFDLAAAGARIIGREHLVCFRDEDGMLLHAVLACSPQGPGALAGACVDILGRMKLVDVEAGLSKAFGRIAVDVGDLPPAEGDDAGEVRLLGALPWLRRVVRVPEIPVSGSDFVSLLSEVTAGAGLRRPA